MQRCGVVQFLLGVEQSCVGRVRNKLSRQVFEAIAIRVETITTRLEAITSRLEAIASRVGCKVFVAGGSRNCYLAGCVMRALQ